MATGRGQNFQLAAIHAEEASRQEQGPVTILFQLLEAKIVQVWARIQRLLVAIHNNALVRSVTYASNALARSVMYA